MPWLVYQAMPALEIDVRATKWWGYARMPTTTPRRVNTCIHCSHEKFPMQFKCLWSMVVYMCTCTCTMYVHAYAHMRMQACCFRCQRVSQYQVTLYSCSRSHGTQWPANCCLATDTYKTKSTSYASHKGTVGSSFTASPLVGEAIQLTAHAGKHTASI